MNNSHKYPALLSRLKRSYDRLVHYCYYKLIHPRSNSEDSQRQEFILNIILTGSLALLILFDFSILYGVLIDGPEYKGFSFLIFNLILGFFAFLHYLSRQGFYRPVSYIFIAIYFIGATYGIYRWGVSLPAGLLTYALIIIASSVLIGSRFSFIVATIIGIILITLAYTEEKHQVVQLWRKEPVFFRNGIEYAAILLIITILSWLSNRETRKSLIRARKSEQALAEKNESLEVIVEERTRELKQSQVERMSQVYRFVEFGRLSSGVFHDLLNPLSVVTSNIQHLKSSLSPKLPDLKEYIDDAVIASRRMEQFVDALKKQVQTQEKLCVFSLNKEIEDALLLFEYKAKKQQLVIQFDAETEINYFGNPLKFHQVIANLISNAIDSYDEVVGNQERVVVIKLSQHSNHIEISILDSGAGISTEVLPNIFDPFFTTKSEHKGIGLGLSTTKSIVEKDFKGEIRVESSGENGSVFTITLPTHL